MLLCLALVTLRLEIGLILLSESTMRTGKTARRVTSCLKKASWDWYSRLRKKEGVKRTGRCFKDQVIPKHRPVYACSLFVVVAEIDLFGHLVERVCDVQRVVTFVEGDAKRCIEHSLGGFSTVW